MVKLESLIKKIEGKTVEKAKEELKKAKINYIEETQKIYSSKIEKGKVVTIEKDEESKKVIIYESRGKGIIGFFTKKRLAILALLALVAGVTLSTSFGKNIMNSITDQIIEIKDGITPPVISGGSSKWSKERTIYVEKDSRTSSELDYYEYCIRENKENECKWEKTETKNVKVTKSGVYYVIFRGVDKKERRSKKSNEEIVIFTYST